MERAPRTKAPKTMTADAQPHTTSDTTSRQPHAREGGREGGTGKGERVGRRRTRQVRSAHEL